MTALPHVIDQQGIEWARSSQAAAEARLDVLIANFETQRAEAALDRQQYEQEAASTQIALLKSQSVKIVTGISDLHVKNVPSVGRGDASSAANSKHGSKTEGWCL